METRRRVIRRVYDQEAIARVRRRMQVASFVKSSRIAQGLPAKVSDSRTLNQVADAVLRAKEVL